MFHNQKEEDNQKPISIDEQISLLEKRGLQIEDKPLAETYLSNVSFHRLSAYTYSFQDNKNNNRSFKEKVTFKEIIELYTFDCKLRLLVFEAIVPIEIALRTQIINVLALKRNNSHWYLEPQFYNSSEWFEKHKKSLMEEIERSNDINIKKYREKYNSPPPCWMVLEMCSIGLLSKIFENLKSSPDDENEKKKIARHFGLSKVDILVNWMHVFTIIRNICAHHGYLWNRKLSKSITMPKTKKTNFDFIQNKQVQTNKLYVSLSALVYALHRIVPEHSFQKDLLRLLDTRPRLAKDLKKMGFPNNWEQEKLWQIAPPSTSI